MPLLPEVLEARRGEVATGKDLSRLALRLDALLAPLVDGPLYLPRDKPLLSKDGGVCADDGSRLRFDPLQPQQHECPACGKRHEGERHHRAWIWRYHLWLSERAIHLALLGELRQKPEYLNRAQEVLNAYVALYREVPNRDNVLGPTRLFFSTYLESIWLTQIVIAATLLRSASTWRPHTQFDSVVRESSDLIASFDEAWSNRQVWNNSALLAAGSWLGDDALVQHALDGRHGIRAQLTRGVASDGMWFEGENYHFFALRGFLLAAEVARWVGVDLYATDPTGGPLAAMYVAPLDTLLPDLTLPARGDSPYGVSIMQPRFAELWEIGRARLDETRVGSLLADLYSRPAPETDDGLLAELAEQETNRPASRLRRDRLGWKSLLWMLPHGPQEPPDQWVGASRLLNDAGVAVLRPRPNRYVSLECGGRPGGHGHPDLLHVSLHGDQPILADFGTASYVSPSLHWYRSTFAHNAPGLPRLGQVARAGRCTAFQAKGDWAWCRAVANRLLGDGTSVSRALVAGPEFVVDVVEVVVPQGVTVDLPVHTVGGNAFSEEHVVLVPRTGELLRVLDSPGPPTIALADGQLLPFTVRTATGRGRWVQVYTYDADTVTEADEVDGTLRVQLVDGDVYSIQVGSDQSVVEGPGGHTVTLAGMQPIPASSPHARMTPIARRSIPCPIVPRVPSPEDWERLVPQEAIRTLGGKHYRRSEVPYSESLGARVAVCASGSQVCFAAHVTKPDVCFRPLDAPDPMLDNEAPDIHSDGLQCFVGTESWQGFVAVPETNSSRVHVRSVAGPVGDVAGVFGEWCLTDDGYSIVVAVDLGRPLQSGDILSVNLVLNEMYPTRVRRAGQLALSGGRGWVYLRGDRESPGEAVMAEVS